MRTNNRFFISLSALLTLCLLLGGLALPAFADTVTEQAVFDEAVLFSDEEAADLEQQADAFTTETGINMMIITTEDNQGKDVRLYGADFYEAQGYTTQDPGILLVIDMEERMVAVVTSDASLHYFPLPQTTQMTDHVYLSLSEGDFAQGAIDFIADAQSIVINYDPNAAVAVDPANTEEQSGAKTLRTAGIVGASIGAIITIALVVMHNNMGNQTAITKDYAQKSGGLVLNLSTDHFLRTHTSRTAIPKKDDSSGSSGGSFTSSSSGGYSGSSSKF